MSTQVHISIKCLFQIHETRTEITRCMMSANYLDTPQICEQPQPLSPLQQDAVANYIKNLLPTLGITEFTLQRIDTQQPRNHSHQLPQTVLSAPHAINSPPHKTPADLTSADCIELDITTPKPAQLAPRPRSTNPSPCPSPRHNTSSPPLKLWTPAEKTRIKHLIRAHEICISTARDLTVNLTEIGDELYTIQYGRAPKKQGGNHDHETKTNTQDTTTSNTAIVNVPSFMTGWLPAPELVPDPVEEKPGRKRCSVGRPLGKMLNPGEDFYALGRCDKHHDKSVFETNMQVQQNTEGGYRMYEHAWKCSGKATKRPWSEPAHRY